MTINRLLARIACFAICVLLTQFAFSQNKTITGKVSDDKGNPVLGATVAAKGSKTGAATDANGAFKISVPPGTTALIITSVGFARQEIDISGKSDVAVSLVTTNAALNEVVVVGYGTARKKDLTGSVTTVTSKEFNTGVINSPDQLMQNKVSGLEVVSNSGQPGSATTVKIRGNSTIYGVGNPLYVVDGVLLDGRNARPPVTLGQGGFGPTPDLNALIYINPYDIQDITILKDASATAIFGSRGADGVVVITTKKASAGAGVKLEAGISEGWNVGYMKKFDILSTGEWRSALHKYSLDTITVNPLDKGGSVDAMNEITQHSTIQNYNVALSGGNDVGKFRASFLASKTPGFLKTNELDKYIGTFSGTYRFLDKRLTIDFGLIAAHTNEQAVLASNTAGSQGNLISAALQWNPTAPLTDANGLYTNLGNGVGNPLALIAAYNDKIRVNTFLGNIAGSFKILKNLEYKLLYSVNQSDGTRATNIDGYLQGFPPITGAGLGVISAATLTSQVVDNTLRYQTNLTPDLSLEALGGFEYWKSQYGNSSFSAQGFNNNLTQTNLTNAQYTDILFNGNTQFLPSVFKDIPYEIQSYFARVNLNWKDKFYFTGTFRADGSSKFGSNNKYGYFPSFGVKWNLANEDFMKDNNLFSTLAIRGTWGITGSQEFPAGASIDQYAFGTYLSASQVNAGNPNLKWQQTNQYDFGLDFGILKNRITGTIDYYNKNTTNILFAGNVIQPGPPAVVWSNLPGHLINNGVEVTIAASIVSERDFSWDLAVNYAYNHNLMKDFFVPGTSTPYVIYTGQINGQGVSGTLSQVFTNDKPLNEYWLKPFNGYDQKGNQQIGANPAYAGDPNPHAIYGGSTTLRYKKLSLVINGGGSSGYLIYNNTGTSVTNISGIAQGRNIDKLAYNSQESPSSGVAASQRFLEKGNFFKLRNASVTYNIGNVGNYLKNMVVYVSGSNLFVVTKFSGFDPEVNIDKSNNGYPSRSIEYIPYPTARSIVVGLNFSL
jgi:iron complex outermembrane receptor protein